MGIWHGTGWNYVVYGCYQAIWVSTAVLFGKYYKDLKKSLHIRNNNIVWYTFTVLRTYIIMLFGRYLIRAKDLDQAVDMFIRSFQFNCDGFTPMIQGDLGLDKYNLVLMSFCIILLIVVDICNNKGFYFRDVITKQNVLLRILIYNIGIFAILIFGIYGPEFSSALFIYGGY